MPMAIQPDTCPCCKAVLHHCEPCWNEHHNGLTHKDYIAPAYYGEPLFDLDNMDNDLLRDKVLEMMPIHPDKNRPYNDGDYKHDQQQATAKPTLPLCCRYPRWVPTQKTIGKERVWKCYNCWETTRMPLDFAFNQLQSAKIADSIKRQRAK